MRFVFLSDCLHFWNLEFSLILVRFVCSSFAYIVFHHCCLWIKNLVLWTFVYVCPTSSCCIWVLMSLTITISSRKTWHYLMVHKPPKITVGIKTVISMATRYFNITSKVNYWWLLLCLWPSHEAFDQDGGVVSCSCLSVCCLCFLLPSSCHFQIIYTVTLNAYPVCLDAVQCVPNLLSLCTACYLLNSTQPYSLSFLLLNSWSWFQAPSSNIFSTEYSMSKQPTRAT